MEVLFRTQLCDHRYFDDIEYLVDETRCCYVDLQ
jgi:hypothetical protein